MVRSEVMAVCHNNPSTVLDIDQGILQGKAGCRPIEATGCVIAFSRDCDVCQTRVSALVLAKDSGNKAQGNSNHIEHLEVHSGHTTYTEREREREREREKERKREREKERERTVEFYIPTSPGSAGCLTP